MRGALVVNVGDALEFVTGGLLRVRKRSFPLPAEVWQAPHRRVGGVGAACTSQFPTPLSCWWLLRLVQ
jgi:hypothetical protein